MTDTKIFGVSIKALGWIDATQAPFYADPTGTADSTAAIQAAVDSVSLSIYAKQGGTVYLPIGTYTTSSTIKITVDNVRIIGAGMGNPAGNRNTNSNPQYGGTIFYPATAFTGNSVISFRQAGTPARTLSGCFASDFSIDGQRLTGSVNGIYWQGFKGGGQHVYVSKVSGVGIVLDGNGSTAFPNGAWDNHFWDWTVDSSSGNGWSLLNGATDNMFVECVSKYNGGHGFYTDANSPSNRWTGGYSYNNTGKGIQCDISMHQKIIAVRVQDCNGGIYLTGTGVGGFMVEGCTLRNCSFGADNTYDAINVTATTGTTGGTITGNDFYVDQGNGNGSPPNYNRHRNLINIASANVRFVSIGHYSEGTSGAAGSYGTAAVADNGANTRIIAVGPSGFPEIKHSGNLRLLWRGSAPEGGVTAGRGSAVLRNDAGAPLYVKGSGVAATGWLPVSLVLAQSAVAASVTGTTAETILASIVVPGNLMGANGRLRITTTWSETGSTNSKTHRVRFGVANIGATAFSNPSNAAAANVAMRLETEIANRNATNSQVGGVKGGSGGFGADTSVPATGTVDTTADQTISITGQLAVGTETLTLESYLVEILPS